MCTDAERKKEIMNNWFRNIHLHTNTITKVFDEYKHVYLNISTQELLGKSGCSNSIILVRS